MLRENRLKNLNGNMKPLLRLLGGAGSQIRPTGWFILNGMNVRDAFVHAKNAMRSCNGQTSLMDANGNVLLPMETRLNVEMAPVNLSAAVTALKVLSSMDSVRGAGNLPDADNDGRVDGGDVIYILQRIAGIRTE